MSDEHDEERDDEQSESELDAPKPCPFCGGEVLISFPDNPKPRIDCQQCNAAMVADYNETRDELLTQWNMRLPEASVTLKARRWEQMARHLMQVVAYIETSFTLLREQDPRLAELLAEEAKALNEACR
jgi:Lar family restriction alleviation protein